MNGQVISEELGKRRGTQPTPGTLYPALKELRAKGLVEMEREGRKTIYTISENGREGLEKACKYFCSAFGEIFREYNRSVRSPKERKIQVRKKTSREGVSKDKRPA